MFKLIKWGVIGGTVMILAGGLFFGRDLFSYASSSGRMLKSSVKEAIPVEFEIQRARDLLEDLIPEMHANLRLVAQEEVEVASLEREVHQEREVVTVARANVQKLRSKLEVQPVVQELNGNGQRDAVEDLSQRFERFRTQELLLAGKEKLLTNRKKSLQVAIARLEKTRLARMELAAQIEALEGQFRLVQAQGSSCDLGLRTTKLAQTQKLLGDLRKRLEIAQRVLEREAQIGDPGPVIPAPSAQSLVEEIDRHFSKGSHAAEAVRSPANL